MLPAMQPSGYADYSASCFPYGYNPALLPNYGSPVTSMYPNPFDIACITDNSPPSDPGKIANLSPEEQFKHMEKRKKNNQAAKISRLKRTQREKQQQDQIRALTEETTRLQLQCNAMKQQRDAIHINYQKLSEENAQLRALLAQNEASLNLEAGGDPKRFDPVDENKENAMPSFMVYPQQLYDNKF